MDETMHGDLRIKFGSVPLLKSAGMVDGAQVSLGDSIPVMVIWPTGPYLTGKQRLDFQVRVQTAADNAVGQTEFVSRGALTEFSILIENDAALAHEIDEELYYVLIRG